MEIYFKDRVEILLDEGVINAVIWTTNFLNPQKFPQAAPGRLDLFPCLVKVTYNNGPPSKIIKPHPTLTPTQCRAGSD